MFEARSRRNARLLLRPVIAGHDRHPCPLDERLGRILQPHGADGLRGRADEGDASLDAGFGEFGVLGEEAVAGMDALRPGMLGDLDDVRPSR